MPKIISSNPTIPQTPDVKSSSSRFPFFRKTPAKPKNEPPIAVKPEDIKTLSWLEQANNITPGQNTTKFFALECGDAFIGNTALEGEKFHHAFIRFTACLKKVLGNINAQPLKKLSLFSQAEKIAEDISYVIEEGLGKESADQAYLIKKLSHKLIHRVSSLKSGEEMLNS